MMVKIAKVLAAAGAVLATVGSQACFFVIMDEPNCPKSFIKLMDQNIIFLFLLFLTSEIKSFH